MARRAKFTIAKHALALGSVYADALEMAYAQDAIDLRPPGHISLEPRERGGRYAYWSRYVDGKIVRDYLGPEGGGQHQAALAQIADLKRYQGTAKNLRRLGFASLDHEAALVVAELFAAGLFAAGGVLIGTRAFGAILNQIGWKAAPLPRHARRRSCPADGHEAGDAPGQGRLPGAAQADGHPLRAGHGA